MASVIKGWFAVFLLIFVAPSQMMAIPGDQNWDQNFTLPPGVNGDVFGLAAENGNLYVAGNFTQAGDVEVNNIARWDGTNWFPLGEGISGSVYSVIFLGTNLYVGGRFDRAGNVNATNIAMWDGSAWHDLNGGTGPQESFILSPAIFCLSTYDDALYASGIFQSIGSIRASSIAKWDGTNWASLGAGLNLVATNDVFGQQIIETESGTVFSMTFVGENLYVGGLFNWAGSSSATNIAQWNGTNWSNLGTGVNGSSFTTTFAGEPYSGWVHALESFEGNLYVGGDFTNAGGLTVTNLAQWNGSAWQNVDGGFSGAISCLFSNNGSLFAGGYFKAINGNKTKGIAKWNNIGGWQSLSNGINGAVYRICANGNRIVAGGEFGIAGGKPAAFVAEWDGSNWSALGEGEGNLIIGTIISLAVANGKTYVAGRLSSAGTNETSFLASWNGTIWTALDHDFVGTQVKSVAAESNKVFVGGDFRMPAHGITNLAAWDGTNWTGFGVESGTYIDRVVVSGNNVFVSGSFTSIGGVSANNLAVWNGVTWKDIGNEFSTNLQYFGMLLVKDGDLYVSTFPSLARWNGTNWSAVEGLVDTNRLSLHVESMTLYRDQIVTFSSYPESCLMRWDGTNWFKIPHPFAPGFLQIVGSGSYLYAYGPMTNGQGEVWFNISKWDGLNWFPLASGLEKPAGSFFGPVMAAKENTVAVAGNFTTAGGKESYHFGIWHEPPLPELTQPRRMEDGSFAFRLLGSEGQNVEIQFSDNLLDWIPLQTNSLSSSPLDVTNVPPENASRGFYRLQQVP